MNWLRRIFGSSTTEPEPVDRLFAADDGSERCIRVKSALEDRLLPELQSIVVGYAVDLRRFSWTPVAVNWMRKTSIVADEPPVHTDGPKAVCRRQLDNSRWFSLVAAESINELGCRWRIRTEFTVGRSGYVAVGISYAPAGCSMLTGSFWNDIATKTDFMVAVSRWTGYGGRSDDAHVFHDGEFGIAGGVQKSTDLETVILVEVDLSKRTFVVGFRGADGLLKQIEVRLPTAVPITAVWRPAVTFADDVSATFLSWPDDVNLPTKNRVQVGGF